MEWRRFTKRASTIVCGAFSAVLLIHVYVVGQTGSEGHQVQEVWQGLVLSFDVHRSYSLSVRGLTKLESPHMYRDSEYFAGLRISHPVAKAFRFGIECLHDRAYLSNSSLFLENRCAVDVLRRWDISPATNLYLQPKLELRSLAGSFDQRLKLRAELLHHLPAVRGTFRIFLEPAIDRRFHGFERITAHAGILWPVGKRIKIEIFDSAIVAKRPDYNVDAIGMMVFVRLRNKEKGASEIAR